MHNLAGGKTVDIAIAGFGHVARALARILAELKTDAPAGGCPFFRVIAVSDSSGCLLDRNGIDGRRLLELARAKEGGAALGGAPGALRGSDALVSALEGRWPPILVETGPTQIRDGGDSKLRSVAALRGGSSVVLASKGPVAAAWEELAAAAGGEAELARRLRFSATVGAGMPVIDAGRALALGSPIRGIAACLNGTSSLVLGLMEEGLSLHRAVARAQELGMAEADPAADLDGLDAAAKLCILARAVLGAPIKPSEVARESVREVTESRIASASARGGRVRAVGRLRFEGGALIAAVRLEELPASSPLAVSGGSCAVLFDSERSGELSLVGKGAGPVETASALLRDLRILAGAAR
jgi:homoserine dehydrogenase